MKSYEIKPTKENLINTYNDDSIKRRKNVISFAKTLASIEESCSIALDGDWGTGKTFFVNQVKMLLEANNEYIKEIDVTQKEAFKIDNEDFGKHLCVYYDAWKNDDNDEPVLSLIYEISKTVKTFYKFKDDEGFLNKAAALCDAFGKTNIKTAIKTLKGNNPFHNFKDDADINNDINDFMRSLLLGKGDRLVVFVDELDRCKPSYAVKLLERIKHYFDNDKITFVFSTNIQQLQHTIQQFYGNGFDATRYLDRFFDLRVSLPPIDIKDYYSSINYNDNYVYSDTLNILIDMYALSMREISKLLRLNKIAFNKMPDPQLRFELDVRALQFSFQYIVPIIIALKIHNEDKYKDFITGRDSSPLHIVLDKFDISEFDTIMDFQNVINDPNATNMRADFKEKVDEIYSVLFIEKSKPGYMGCRIGKCIFNKSIYNAVINAVNLI